MCYDVLYVSVTISLEENIILSELNSSILLFSFTSTSTSTSVFEALSIMVNQSLLDNSEFSI